MRQKATWLVEQWGGGEAPSDKMNIYVTCDEDRVPTSLLGVKETTEDGQAIN